jgi:uncharacterized protein (DUF1800 family)
MAVPAARDTAARELDPHEQARHVLHRLAFGPRPGDVEVVRRMGVDRWIEQQLHPGRINDPQLATVLSHYRHLDKSASDLRAEFPPPGQLRRLAENRMTPADSVVLRAQVREGRRVIGELVSARVARAVVSERQLAEVMTDFWLNHFNVFAGRNAQMRYHLPSYERTAIRPHVLGRFRDLLGAVAKSPAMLTYLDNATSVADSTRPTLVDRRVAERRMRRRRGAVGGRPGARADSARLEQVLARRPTGVNENYARELLELHTLGVDGGYTQDDVIEVARALTGWTVRPGARGDGGFVFNPVAHDAGEKRILGQRFPAGRGESEGDAVLDLLARHPSTARHIASRLATRLVADEPPADLVDRAAEVFRQTDGDLREVVRAIVTSPEFFSRAVYRGKVKSPFEVVVSAARALGARADTTAVTAQLVARLGQPIYGHQAPDGWPETGDAWMNTGAILSRINFGLAVAAHRVPGARTSDWPAYESLRRADRATQVTGVIDALLGGVVAPETRQVLESGTNPLLGRATARDTFADAPGRGRPLSGLDQVIGLALGAPEFQRR